MMPARAAQLPLSTSNTSNNNISRSNSLTLLPTASSAVLQLEQSQTHSRDSSRSSSGWERLPDGTWFRREYYKLNQQMSLPQFETGKHVLNNIFTGSFDVARNVEWIKSKDIHRVLVLGTADVPQHDQYRLRIVPIEEGQLEYYLDSIVSLIIEAVAEDANVLLLDKDGRTYSPACIAAYLLCSGWTFDWAVERIEGIFQVSFHSYKLECLKYWNQLMEDRRADLVAEVKRTQSNNMPKILQSPLPITAGGESVVVTSVPSHATLPVVQSCIQRPTASKSTIPAACPPPSNVREAVPALPPRNPQAREKLSAMSAATSVHDVTPTTTNQWSTRTATAPIKTSSSTAIQNILRKLDAAPAERVVQQRETMTA